MTADSQSCSSPVDSKEVTDRCRSKFQGYCILHRVFANVCLADFTCKVSVLFYCYLSFPSVQFWSEVEHNC